MKGILLFISLFCTLTIFAQDITTFPYFQGFEGTTGTLHENYPTGWTAEDLNTDPNGNQPWQIIKNAPSSQNAHTDSSAIHTFCHANQANDDWLFTPSIQMTAGSTYELEFWYAAMSIGTSEKLKVHAGDVKTGAAMAATTELWKEEAISSDTYTKATVSFTPSADGIYYFAFHSYSDAFSFILLIDDVTITESGVGMEEQANAIDYQLMGNPVKNTVRMNFTTATTSTAKAQLIAADGKFVKEIDLEANIQKLAIDVTDVENGVYYLVVRGEQWMIKEKMVILR